MANHFTGSAVLARFMAEELFKQNISSCPEK